MKCEYCGTALERVPEHVRDEAWEEGYCNKLHRKYVEKQLIKDGKDVSQSFGIMKDSKYRDSSGEKIWFPKDGRPYYDRALQQTFNTIGDKQRYMKSKNLAMDGSSDKKAPIEAGDTRKSKTVYFT